MRWRFGLGVIAAMAALWLFAGTSWACLTADLTTSPSAGPGDPVSFGISGIEPGAHYTVTFQGRTVASGTNTTNNNGVSGSFSMPDLGSQEQTTYAEADTIHPEDGESFHLTSSIEYLPPAPAAAPEQPAATSAPVPQARHHVHQQAPIAASPQVAKPPLKPRQVRPHRTPLVASQAPMIPAQAQPRRRGPLTNPSVFPIESWMRWDRPPVLDLPRSRRWASC
jgi:hypothetical protein